MPHDPTNLKNRTKTYALRIIQLFQALPKSGEAQVIGKQILRSGTSVGAQNLRPNDSLIYKKKMMN